jgi:hypothetical protein
MLDSTAFLRVIKGRTSEYPTATANTVLQTNTPGCHGPCFLRPALGVARSRFLRATRGQGP